MRARRCRVLAGVVAVVAAVGLTAAACGGDDDDSGAGDTTAAAVFGADAQPAAAIDSAVPTTITPARTARARTL